jgi:hypothetical protein
MNPRMLPLAAAKAQRNLGDPDETSDDFERP